MLRVLIICALTALLATSGRAVARADDWRAIAVSGDVHVADSTEAVAVGATFAADVVIETGANGQATFARQRGSIVVGPGARVRLSREDANVKVESGAIVVHRAGAVTGETLSAGQDSDLAHSAPSAAQAEPSTDTRPLSLPRFSTPQSASEVRAPTYVPSSAAAPAMRQSFDGSAMGRYAGASSAPRLPLQTGGAPPASATPGLRIAPADDLDLSAAGSGGRAAGFMSSDATPNALPTKTDEQELETLRGAWAEVKQQNLPPINEQAANQLLRGLKPNTDSDADRAATAQATSIAQTGAIVLSVLIIVQLAVMGLLALRRHLARTKAAQSQPRWTAI